MNLGKSILVLVLVAVACTSALGDGGAAQSASSASCRLDPELAKAGLWVLGIVAALTLIAAGSIGFTAVWKQSDQSKTIVSDAIRGGIVMRMGTIFGIVTAACVLALCGALNEGAIAFLSGIAGYVLGGIQKPSGDRE